MKVELLQAVWTRACDIPGVDMAFPLKDYGGDLAKEHRADCSKVRKHEDIGCAACRFTTCGRCYWPKRVRCWRRVETGENLAEFEGYSRVMEAPTAMKLS